MKLKNVGVDFLAMLLDTLGASFFGNTLAGKGAVAMRWGKAVAVNRADYGVARADNGIVRAGRDF